jgi:polysaccharide biosynthesis/export protein
MAWAAAVSSLCILIASANGSPQTAPPRAPGAATPERPWNAGSAATQPADYLIGPNDVLSVVFWREKDLSAEVVVRPDGKISLPLLNDVQVGGLTPEQLRLHLADEARRFVEDPVVTVIVKQIANNKVFIVGEVRQPGPQLLSGPTTVLQLIAMAGGLTDLADRKHIVVTRTEGNQSRSYEFNYSDVVKGKGLAQNILLKPGDTVVVP